MQQRDRLRVWLCALLIIAAGFAAYANSFSGVFLFDDIQHIVENPYIRSLHPITQVLFPPPGTVVAGRPLVNLTVAYNYALSGLEVWSYHLVNLLLHLAAALALFGCLRQTFLSSRLRDRFGEDALWMALSAALIWTVHPLQTQSVNYIIQRAEILAGLFTFLSLYGVIRGIDSRRPGWWYASAVAACACGVASKPLAAITPLMILAYDRLVLGTPPQQVWRQRAPLYLALASTWMLVGALNAFGPHMNRPVAGYQIDGGPWTGYLLSQPGVILHYLHLAAWPSPLVFDYGWPIARSWQTIVPPAAIILALLAAVTWSARRSPAVAFAGIWFLGFLAPTSSIFPLADLGVEHRMSLPLAAVVVLAVVGARQLLRRMPPALAPLRTMASVTVLTIVAGACVQATLRRNLDYQSDTRLWADVAAKRPRSPRARTNFGLRLANQGRLREAIAEYREALRLQPSLAEAHNNLGVALAEQGGYDEAIVLYREALRVKPEYAEAWVNLGVAFSRLDRPEEAIAALRQALSLNPELVKAHNNLGVLLMGIGRLDEAVAAYREALRLEPGYADAYTNLGVALTRQERFEDALAEFGKALRLAPGSAAAHNNVGVVLIRLGRRNEAIAHYREALRLRPEYATARRNLEEALQQAAPAPQGP